MGVRKENTDIHTSHERIDNVYGDIVHYAHDPSGDIGTQDDGRFSLIRKEEKTGVFDEGELERSMVFAGRPHVGEIPATLRTLSHYRNTLIYIDEYAHEDMLFESAKQFYLCSVEDVGKVINKYEQGRFLERIYTSLTGNELGRIDPYDWCEENLLTDDPAKKVFSRFVWDIPFGSRTNYHYTHTFSYFRHRVPEDKRFETAKKLYQCIQEDKENDTLLSKHSIYYFYRTIYYLLTKDPKNYDKPFSDAAEWCGNNLK